MRDLYKAWAETRLPSDQGNMAGFCFFLGSDAGHVLRMDGLQWIAAVMRADPETGKWYRDSTSNAFMGLLEAAVLEDADELTKNQNPIMVITLAAAYAEVGRFPEALKAAEHGLYLAEDAGSVPLAARIREHISLYRAKQPVRDIR